MSILKKIFDFLTPPEKQKAFYLLILISILAILDMLGAASILPFIAILANPELISTNIVFNFIFKASSIIGIFNSKEFIFFLGIVVFIFFIISTIIRALTQYIKTNFVLIREYTITKRLMKIYLNQPYTWFLNRHSADLGKNILSDVEQIINGAIMPLATLISQAIVVLLILIFLLINDVIVTLSVGLFLALSYGMAIFFMKNTLSRISLERAKANNDRFIVISEAFGAFKEVKSRGLEEFYIDRFKKPAVSYAKSQALAQIITHLPRYFIEGISFGALVILILVLILRDNRFITIIPIITLYALAGYRLIPALQQVYSSITLLKFLKPTLFYLHKDLTNLHLESISDTENPILFKKNINLKNIYFNYLNNKDPVLKNININIPYLSKIGIVGVSGSGKTTIVDIILGLLVPTHGLLRVDGNVITHLNRRSWQKNIGYVPQQIYLSDASISSNIAFGVNVKDINQKAVEQAAKISNIHDFIAELPNYYDTSVGERGIKLSGGQRQRIGIARALYHNPMLLIFDEATSSLDNLTEKAITDAIQNLEGKITIIIIAHRLTTIKKCDNIFFIKKGEIIAQGTYKELFKENSEFRNMASI
jgi:ABC-type multidrug transport system fused ATPase/permease subunit